MAPGATAEELDAVVRTVQDAGGSAFVSRGVHRTIVGLVGDVEQFESLNLRAYPGVADVVRISAPYKLVSRENHPAMSTVDVEWCADRAGHVHADRRTVRGRDAGADAGRRARWRRPPARRCCAVAPTSRGHRRTHFKASARRACRSSPKSAPRSACRSSPRSSTHTTSTSVASYADMLQIGTRNMQNFGLLQAVGSAGKPVMLKRGMNATIEEWLMAAEYVAQRGNLDIVLCERGIRTFETATRNTLDISAVPVVHSLSHLPVVVDPSLSANATGRRQPASATTCQRVARSRLERRMPRSHNTYRGCRAARRPPPPSAIPHPRVHAALTSPALPTACTNPKFCCCGCRSAACLV